MIEVTRIACPGCRTPLKFKPEALDFPANCGACDCRFSVGIYVRLSCPQCRLGSRIRESYRGLRVRCNRCQHDFLSEEGRSAGDEERLLVARLLDADTPSPPETVQPLAPPGTVQGPDQGPATVSGSGIWQVSRVVEVERPRAEVGELRARHDRELANARRAAKQADDRWSTAEGKLVEAMLELGEVEQRTARLLSERDEALDAANRERSALLSRLDRLNAALASAKRGEYEAERLAEEALRKFDAAAADFRSEQRKRLESGRVVEELRAATGAELEGSRRAAEAVEASLVEENRRLAVEVESSRSEGDRLLGENEHLAELVERLLGENRALGEQARQLLAENRRLSDQMGEDRRSLMEFERESGASEEAGRLREENRRLTGAIEQARRAAESLQVKLALELQRVLGGSGQHSGPLGNPAEEPESPPHENGRPLGEGEAALEATPVG